MRTHLIAAGVILTSVGVTGQDVRPAFEVASIKLNTTGSTDANAGRVQGDVFTASNATVIQLVRFAFAVQEFQIAGQPGWAAVDRFDITAKLPAGAKPDMWPVMVQNLLAERFVFRFHRETREANVLALVVESRTTKLTAVDASRCAAPSGPCGMTASSTQILGRGQSMDQLASRLSRSIGQPVVNRTGLGGIFDFTIEWTVEDQFRGAGATASPAIFTALAEQLGLRLRGERGQVEVLVFDRLERPTPD